MKKVTNNEELAQQVMNEMYKEFSIAKDLLHPNIVNYKLFVRRRGDRENEEEFHIILELLEGGNLRQQVTKEGRITDKERIRSWSRQILQGLEYLHS